MTLDEFKANNQELYASVLEEGGKIGAEREKKRVSELLNWSSQHAQCSDIVNEAIANGKNASDIMPAIMSKVMGGTNGDAAEDNPEDISVVDPSSASAGGGDAKNEEKNVDEQIKIAAKAFGIGG